MTTSPLIIVGTSRSGSTLLSRVLNNHPKLAILPETWVFSNIELLNLNHYPKNFEYKYLGKLLSLNLKNFEDNSKKVVEDYFHSESYIGGKNLSKVIGEIGTLYAKENNKPFWGEKTPAHSLRLKRVYKLFPEATVVWIIRDPRDVLISYIKRWNNSDFTDETYILNTVMLLKFYFYKLIEQNPYKNMLKIRYEQLASDPVKELNTLFSNIGLDFNEAYLKTENFVVNNKEAEEAHKNLDKKINISSVGSYKEKIAVQTLQKVEFLLRVEMEYLGYQPKMSVDNTIDLVALKPYLKNFENMKTNKIFRKNRTKEVLRMYYNVFNPFK